MKALRLDHVQLAMPAGREAEARAFWTDLLGVPEIPKPAELTARGGCWFMLANHQLHIGVDPDFRPAKKAHIALVIDDLATIRAVIAARGGAIHDDTPIDGRARFFTEDPFGNRIELLALEPA